MKNLYFFTNSYPYDIGEQWKTNELNVLKNNFNITVIPFFSHSKKLATTKIENIRYQNPIFEKLPYVSLKKQLVLIFLNKLSFLFFKELFNKKVYKNKTKFIQWLSASYKILYLSKNKKLQEILKTADSNTILYFFWGKETSEIIPVIKTKAKIVVRYHGYDLYEERSHNYIPYRRLQLKNIHSALFVSKQGKEYLKNRYENIKFKTQLFRLGTIGEGMSLMSNDNVLRIFTCSSLIPLKRVDLIAKAIISLNFKVEWTHIGSGEMLDKIRLITEKCPTNIIVKFTGQIGSNKVKSFYVNKSADLFINASTTEGVPVSIMEAMSAGIPIFATNVGGTSELVDSSIGELLPANITPKILAKKIIEYSRLNIEQKQRLRNNSYNRFEEKSNAEKLANELSYYFLKI